MLECRHLILAGLLSITATACGGVLADDTDTRPDSFDGGAIDWQEVQPGYEVGTFTVPVDYRDPNGATVELFVARRHASNPSERIGSLLVNPGGPGFPGTQLVAIAEQFFDVGLLERFDIVGWDPRGTGTSQEPIVCIDDHDRYFAEPPLIPVGSAQVDAVIERWTELSDRCLSSNPVMMPMVGTNNSARDMDVLRQALGESSISYLGFSYGTLLGATWATLFPDTVRAAVLDGAANPVVDAFMAEQAAGLERMLEVFLSRCSGDPDCAFHNDGDAAGAFDELMLDLAVSPVPTIEGRSPAGRLMARWATKQAMYDAASWPTFAQALASAADGDGTGLLSMYDALFQMQPDGTYGNQMDALFAINCADRATRSSYEEDADRIDGYSRFAPRMFPEGSIDDYYCSFLPPAVDPRVEVTGAGAGPILVIGGTGDALTPIESATAMADTLEEGRLLTVGVDQHTSYSASQCARDAVTAYLVHGTMPAEGTVCG